MNGAKLVWWLMTSFAALTIAVAALLYSSVADETSELRRVHAMQGERVSTLEAHTHESQRRLGAIEARLISMDEKIGDVLIAVRRKSR